LERYYDIVKNTFQYPYTLGVYLTPTGADPKCEPYVAMDYTEVGAILTRVVENSPDIRDTPPLLGGSPDDLVKPESRKSVL